MVFLPANLKDSIEKNKSEWLEITKKGKLDYHERQFQTPYRSTVLFCDWLKSLGLLSPHDKREIADIGAGGGRIYFIWQGDFQTLILQVLILTRFS